MFEKLLTNFIKDGELSIIRPNGEIFTAGRTSNVRSSPAVVVRLKSMWTAVKIAMRPELRFGEAYMAGDLTIEKGTLWDLLDLCGRNLAHRRSHGPTWFFRLYRTLARQLQQRNSQRAARKNVAHHYDLSESLFRTFLDRDLQYSCAYFRSPDMTLDEAQAAKKRHIISKLLLAPGQRVLDIGCGWGGLAISIAKTADVVATAVTLSKEQLAVARARALAEGVDHKVSFEARDYRELAGPFHRVVSVGMFEHVGRPNYHAFFKKITTILTDDGVALIHSIGRMDGPGLTSAWTRKYIFPGGYIPALSEVLPAIEKAGLWITDIEILRLHYAETLRAWRNAFLDNLHLMRSIYDERFCRMWEFYLAGSEMAFRYDGLMVFQIQLSKKLGTIPLTRDYMVDDERALENAEPEPARAAGARSLLSET